MGNWVNYMNRTWIQFFNVIVLTAFLLHFLFAGALLDVTQLTGVYCCKTSSGSAQAKLQPLLCMCTALQQTEYSSDPAHNGLKAVLLLLTSDSLPKVQLIILNVCPQFW